LGGLRYTHSRGGKKRGFSFQKMSLKKEEGAFGVYKGGQHVKVLDLVGIKPLQSFFEQGG